MSVYIAKQQFVAKLKRIEKANLKNHGKSPSLASMKSTGVILDADENGMIVIDDWREELDHLNLVPTQTPEEQVQDAILTAIERCKKRGGQWCVVRFTAKSGRIRYRVYPDTKYGFKAFDHAYIGERVESIGSVSRRTFDLYSNRPLPFFPETSFKDAFDALPLNREWEITTFGKPYKEWLAEVKVQSGK